MGKWNKIGAMVTAAALVVSMSSSAIFAATAETPQGTAVLPEKGSFYAADEVIVVYRDDASSTNINRYIKNTDARTAETTALDGGRTMSVLTVDSPQSMGTMLQEYADSPVVDYVQPNYIYRLPSKVSTSGADSEADRFWHLDNINLEGAKERFDAFVSEKKASKVRVAVLDSGVDLDHEDLQAHISRDLSKKVTKTAELEPLTGDSDIFDGHGTHVCGIIGATADNHIGVNGVASSVIGDKLEMAVIDIFNFYDDEDDGGDGDGVNDYWEYGADTASIVKGLDYAKEIDAQVINMSIGGYEFDRLEQAAIKTCTDAGITIVAAAGNEGTSLDNYPSDYEHVIGVIASDKTSTATDWSNYGWDKEITAPGEEIYSTIPEKLTKYSLVTGDSRGEEYDTEKYGLMDGTSMATPITTGVVAILYALAPSSNLTRVENAICKTAKDIGPDGKDAFTAHGLLDAGEAAEYIIAPSTPTGYKARLSTSSKTSSTNYRTVQLSWNKMLRATGYRIAYKASGAKNYTYKNVSSSKNSLTLKLTAGKKYQFKIRGYRTVGGVKNYSPYTALKTVTTLKAPTLNKVTKTGADSNKLKWTNIDGESGYQVYKRKGKNGKWSTVKWKDAGQTTFTDKNINKKYTYYYKVRAYKNVTVDGKTKKVYGPWSTVRSR